MSIYIGDKEIKNLFAGGPIEDYSAMQGPAPDGFHVPLATEWQGLKTIMTSLSLNTSGGWRINLHMPFAGSRECSDTIPYGKGSYGLYWSSSPSDSSSNAYMLNLSSSVSADRSDYRTYGCSVRCFKDSFEIPTSSWTVINGTLGGAGIFWNQTDGLISITSDGTTGYTIMDKNLGATTVYLDGDTVSDANCGNYYQWGNNYGFPFTGNVTSSTTKVDATVYGPGNYYTGSTFIKALSKSYNRDSSNNDNLWGGVTGIIEKQKEAKAVYVGDDKVWPEINGQEYIEIVMACDSNGDLKIPVAGYSTSGSQNSAYSWEVSYDNGPKTTYTGTGSTTPLTIATGLTANSEHTVKITPTNETYGWARAFGFFSSGIASLLKSIVYDKSYIGYAESATNTGDYFRYYQYSGCTSLTTPAAEVLPSSVTSIGTYFRSYQYSVCNKITKAAAEVLPNSVTSIGNRFRYYQYNGCTCLTTATAEVLPSSVTSIGTYFRGNQYYSCAQLTTAASEVLSSSVTSIGNYFRSTQYGGCVNLTTAAAEALPSSITSIGGNFRRWQYQACKRLTTAAAEVLPSSITSIGAYFRGNQYEACTILNTITGLIDLNIGGNNYRKSQFKNCTTNKIVKVLSNVGYAGQSDTLDNTYVTQVQVPSAYLQNFKDSTIYPWSAIDDSKFVGY